MNLRKRSSYRTSRLTIYKKVNKIDLHHVYQKEFISFVYLIHSAVQVQFSVVKSDHNAYIVRTSQKVNSHFWRLQIHKRNNFDRTIMESHLSLFKENTKYLFSLTNISPIFSPLWPFKQQLALEMRVRCRISIVLPQTSLCFRSMKILHVH